MTIDIDMSQFYGAFFDEAEELLAEAERLLLKIDLKNPDPEELNAIFRAAHSIKGGAATFGFNDMTEITHVLENLLDKIRKKQMPLTTQHVDAFLLAKDVLTMELEGHRSNAEVDLSQVELVKSSLRCLSDAGGVSITPLPISTNEVAKATEIADESSKEVNENSCSGSDSDSTELEDLFEAELAKASVDSSVELTNHFKITFKKLSKSDAVNIGFELGVLGKGEIKFVKNGVYEATLQTESSQDEVISVFSFITDADKMNFERITDKVDSVLEVKSAVIETVKSSAPKVEVAEEYGFGLFEDENGVKKEEGYGFFAPFKPHPDAAKSAMLVDDNTPTPNKTEKSVTAEAAAKVAEKKPAAKSDADSSIRVGIEKVDQLINLVGELVITQAMIQQKLSKLDPVENEDLVASIGQLTRNTRDLQESVMSIRMMPIDFVFSRFPRMVRDLAAKLEKKVEFVTKGATTELDKSLIERIVDPLTHLVRNSVDHGVELPEARRKSGKDEIGTLTLSAAHKGGSIVIEVTDDGAGLNREKILAKAISNGLTVSESMPDSEVFALIFAPGFSTAEIVTDVSGRGVGMDVVKRNITSMGGTVEIRSALGFGTTISIALPLTLAILDGMSVSLGRSVYVIPLNLIVETLQPKAEDLKTVAGQGQMVFVRGEYLPVISLHKLFNHETDITDPTLGVLVLLEAEGKRSALFVDGLVTQQQVVIKSLETNYRKVPGVSGATIMGDGSVALILDVPAIIQMGQNF